MGVYEWVLLGVTYAVILTAFFVVFALGAKKNQKFKEQISQAILCSKMRWNTKITLLVLGALVVLGCPAAIIGCSYLVEPAPQEGYAVLMIAIALCSLFCLYAALASFYNSVCATQEGVWVRRIFLKTKFYRYEDIICIPGRYWGSAIFFKAGGERGFSVRRARDTNAKQMLELLEERVPHLKKWM